MILKTEMDDLIGLHLCYESTSVVQDALAAHAYKRAKRDMQEAAKKLGDEHVLGALDAFEIRATEYHAKMLAGECV